MINEPYRTITLETFAQRSYNYFTRMVDKDSLPYFNIFWTEPAEAAHDWPDFGDVTTRQLQGAIMGRVMTGQEAPVEKIWYQKVLSYLNPRDGLLYRPRTGFSAHVAEPGDNSLTLYALVTAYLDNPDQSLRDGIFKMVDSLAEKAQIEESFRSGFMIKSLMVCGRWMKYDPAVKLAGKIIQWVFVEKPQFSPDNTFRHGGHMHGNLRTLVGAADYALYVKDPILFSRVDALYRYVRSTATRFGFLPESIGRQGDVVLCETCAIMDYLGLAVTLANHGHPEYWGDVERIVRNHLIESQITNASWLKSDPTRADTDQFTWRDVGERMIGGYAGWSSPNHILAVRESLNQHWGGPELHNKTRAFQNCCGGSGTHAFFIAWKNSARFTDQGLSVHLHLDKSLPQAEIRSFQPYRGLLTIQLKEPCKVKVRIPEFVAPGNLRVTANGEPIEGKVWGNYLELGPRPTEDLLEVRYALPIEEEDVTVGNPGFRQYRYHVTWKGDTVVRMEPLGNDVPTGYSDFDKKQVPVFYGKEGPGPLYQREHVLQNIDPEISPSHLDCGKLDLWYIP